MVSCTDHAIEIECSPVLQQLLIKVIKAQCNLSIVPIILKICCYDCSAHYSQNYASTLCQYSLATSIAMFCKYCLGSGVASFDTDVCMT